MVKKFKIKEFNDEPELEIRDSKDLTRISIDDLKTEVNLVVPELNNQSLNKVAKDIEPSKLKSTNFKKSSEKKINTVEAPNKKIIVETKTEVINDQVTFERNQLKSFLFKGLSFALILMIVDIVLHFFKVLEDKEFLKIENFDSLYFDDNQLINLVKILVFLLIVNWTAPHEKVIVRSRGIFCKRIVVQNLFYSSLKVFLSWEEIKAVQYKSSLFEPYLYFYGKDNVLLGQIHFAIENKKEFFKFLEQHAGKTHPFTLVQKEID